MLTTVARYIRVLNVFAYANYSEATRVGYLDDVTLGGAAHILALDVEHIKASAE